MLSAILQGIGVAIYNQVIIGKNANKIDKNTKIIMKYFKSKGQDMSVYRVSGDIYVVYIGNDGYLFNLKTKVKCLCNPNERMISNNCKLMYKSS